MHYFESHVANLLPQSPNAKRSRIIQTVFSTFNGTTLTLE